MSKIFVKKDRNFFTIDAFSFLHKNISNGAIGLYTILTYLDSIGAPPEDYLHEISNDSKQEIVEQLAELMKAGIITISDEYVTGEN